MIITEFIVQRPSSFARSIANKAPAFIATLTQIPRVGEQVTLPGLLAGEVKEVHWIFPNLESSSSERVRICLEIPWPDDLDF